MAKLNQIVAVVNSRKNDTKQKITEIYQKTQKTSLFEGLSKTYETIVDGGEQLPNEGKVLQLKCGDVIKEFKEITIPFIDTIFTQDITNTKANSSIIVNGKSLIDNVPVTNLLFLEKTLIDFQTFINHLPVLDPSQDWEYSEKTDCYVGKESWKYHTKKKTYPLIKAPATDKHPAQVEMVTEDVNVGKWKTVNFSGGILASRKNEILSKVKNLIESVKEARERANLEEVTSHYIGKVLLDYVFGE